MTHVEAARKQTEPQAGADSSKALYGGRSTRRITVRDIAGAKQRGEKWPMLTAYDAMTASVFDEAGIPCCWSATRWATATSATTRPSR